MCLQNSCAPSSRPPERQVCLQYVYGTVVVKYHCSTPSVSAYLFSLSRHRRRRAYKAKGEGRQGGVDQAMWALNNELVTWWHRALFIILLNLFHLLHGISGGRIREL